MTSTAAVVDLADGEVPATRRLSSLPSWLADIAAVLAFVAAGIAVFGHLWVDPANRVLADNTSDQLLFEWMLRHTANAVTDLSNPFLAPELGAPQGANLMGNTSMVLLGLLLTPITLLAGPATSFAVLVTLALAGTATSWYFLLSRRIVRSRVAAFAGALFCGFAPGMVSQATGHPQMAAQFLIPPMIAVLIGMGRGGTRRALLDGLFLGLLVSAQILIGEETLFIAAFAMAVFVAIYAAQRWPEVRRRLPAGLYTLLVGAAVTLVLVGYPLWLQFLSPHAYHGLPNGKFAADLGSVTAYAGHSLAGDPAVAARYSANASEQVLFLGLPLLAVAVTAAVLLWRVVWLRSAALTAALFVLASFGAQPQLREQPFVSWGPWSLLDDLPLFRDVIPVRLGLVAVPVIGLLIAVSWERAATAPVAKPLRLLWPVALVLALLPTLPTPIPAVGRQPLPEFITAQRWRECARPGQTMVIFPAVAEARRAGDYAWRSKREQMRWQAGAELAFAVPDGYYIARGADGHGRWGQPSRGLDKLVNEVVVSGVVPTISDAQREQARSDLEHWRAGCLAVLADQPHDAQVRQTLADLLGRPPVRLADVWAWKID